MNAFQKTVVITIIATLLLITVGSLVRVSGAGLGCPDWPKCWGRWLPPSSVDELDMAYIQEKGYDLSEFNPIKMWIEYVNRLIGVTIGFLILATFLRAMRYRKTRPVIFRCALLSVFLVGFQGWLGGQVVRSGLHPGIITLHMILAVGLLSVLIYAAFQSMQTRLAVRLPRDVGIRIARLAGIMFALTCIQMILGTRVREAVDPFIKDAGGLPRALWLEQVGWIDHIHRASSWLVLGGGILLYRWVRRHRVQGLLRHTSLAVLALVAIQMLLGATLAYAGLPPAAQVLHLTGATLLLCGEFTVILIARSAADFHSDSLI